MAQHKQDTVVTVKFNLAQVDKEGNLVTEPVTRLYHFIVAERENKAIYLFSDLFKEQAKLRRAVEIKQENDSASDVELILCDVPWRIEVASWEVVKREKLTHVL